MRGSFISSLMRASVACLVSGFGLFLYILVRCHKSKGITGQFGTGVGSFRITFRPCGFDQLYQSANGSISDVKQPARPQGRGIGLSGRTIEDEQCQRIGGGYEAVKFRFLLFL